VPASQGAESEAARDRLALAEFPRVFVNFSVNFVKQSISAAAARELLLALVERFGARRLMWSAFGQPLDQAVRILNEGLAPLSEDDRAGVLGEGARDLYPQLRTEAAP
jgi:predicted TIM-barrel fold metal-dependent hydrolase